MSDPDIWDAYADLRKMRQEKRANNREQSAALLTRAGIFFEAKNDGAHLIVIGGPFVIDFWPGTGLWIVRGKAEDLSRKKRGVRNLIAFVERARGSK